MKKKRESDWSAQAKIDIHTRKATNWWVVPEWVQWRQHEEAGCQECQNNTATKEEIDSKTRNSNATKEERMEAKRKKISRGGRNVETIPIQKKKGEIWEKSWTATRQQRRTKEKTDESEIRSKTLVKYAYKESQTYQVLLHSVPLYYKSITNKNQVICSCSLKTRPIIKKSQQCEIKEEMKKAKK